jgi:plastocyanin domain-containing protein
MKAAVFIIVGMTVVGIVGGYFLFRSPDDGDTRSNAPVVSGDSVRTENGTQIIHIVARGGYSPRVVTAQADMPTRIEMETSGSYDCSSALTIPSLDYTKQLPATGTTIIDVPAQSKGEVLTGLCAMGMYTFDIEFV